MSDQSPTLSRPLPFQDESGAVHIEWHIIDIVPGDESKENARIHQAITDETVLHLIDKFGPALGVAKLFEAMHSMSMAALGTNLEKNGLRPESVRIPGLTK